MLVFQIYTIPVYELIEIFTKTGLIYNICVHLIQSNSFFASRGHAFPTTTTKFRYRKSFQNHVFRTLGISNRIFEYSLKLNIEFLMTTKLSEYKAHNRWESKKDKQSVVISFVCFHNKKYLWKSVLKTSVWKSRRKKFVGDWVELVNIMHVTASELRACL